jgi:hypothetical protein
MQMVDEEAVNASTFQGTVLYIECYFVNILALILNFSPDFGKHSRIYI